MQTFEKLEDLKEIVEKRMAQPGRHLSNLFGCLFLWSRQDVLGVSRVGLKPKTRVLPLMAPRLAFPS